MRGARMAVGKLPGPSTAPSEPVLNVDSYWATHDSRKQLPKCSCTKSTLKLGAADMELNPSIADCVRGMQVPCRPGSHHWSPGSKKPRESSSPYCARRK